MHHHAADGFWMPAERWQSGIAFSVAQLLEVAVMLLGASSTKETKNYLEREWLPSSMPAIVRSAASRLCTDFVGPTGPPPDIVAPGD
jgi:hypothetical protein